MRVSFKQASHGAKWDCIICGQPNSDYVASVDGEMRGVHESCLRAVCEYHHIAQTKVDIYLGHFISRGEKFIEPDGSPSHARPNYEPQADREHVRYEGMNFGSQWGNPFGPFGPRPGFTDPPPPHANARSGYGFSTASFEELFRREMDAERQRAEAQARSAKWTPPDTTERRRNETTFEEQRERWQAANQSILDKINKILTDAILTPREAQERLENDPILHDTDQVIKGLMKLYPPPPEDEE